MARNKPRVRRHTWQGDARAYTRRSVGVGAVILRSVVGVGFRVGLGARPTVSQSRTARMATSAVVTLSLSWEHASGVGVSAGIAIRPSAARCRPSTRRRRCGVGQLDGARAPPIESILETQLARTVSTVTGTELAHHRTHRTDSLTCRQCVAYARVRTLPKNIDRDGGVVMTAVIPGIYTHTRPLRPTRLFPVPPDAWQQRSRCISSRSRETARVKG